MQPVNILGLETVRGFRTVELYEGDITKIQFPVDVLVISAFAGSYGPVHGTLIESLKQTFGLSVASHASLPALDLRDALGIWISKPIEEQTPFSRLVCVELRGASRDLGETLDNVFACLQLLAAKKIETGVVVLPLLGAGSQRLDANKMATELVGRAKTYLEQAPCTSRLVFVEIDHVRASQVAEAIDRILGRHRVTLPHEQLVGALRQDVANKLHHADALFLPDYTSVRDEWLWLLQQSDVRAAEFGVNSRKLVELMLARLNVPQQHLYKRIRSLEDRGSVAPWICAYMHVLRHLGNESAHDYSLAPNREPPVIAPGDLTAGLFCIQRLLDFWGRYGSHEPLAYSPFTPSVLAE